MEESSNCLCLKVGPFSALCFSSHDVVTHVECTLSSSCWNKQGLSLENKKEAAFICQHLFLQNLLFSFDRAFYECVHGYTPRRMLAELCADDKLRDFYIQSEGLILKMRPFLHGRVLDIVLTEIVFLIQGLVKSGSFQPFFVVRCSLFHFFLLVSEYFYDVMPHRWSKIHHKCRDLNIVRY